VEDDGLAGGGQDGCDGCGQAELESRFGVKLD
jgi:hypothetical protein